MPKYKLTDDQIELLKEQAAISILDETNDKSLIQMAPPCLAEKIAEVGERYPDWLIIPEWKLRQKCDVDERDERTRLAVWDEYSHATRMGRKMRLASILNQSLTRETWNRVYLGDLKKIVWLITPPRSYDSAMKQIVNTGLKRMLEIINLPIVDQKGKVNTAVITQILKTFSLADQRLRGSVVQNVRIQQQSLNLNANVENPKTLTSDDLLMLDPDELDALETKLDNASKHKSQEIKNLPRDNDFSNPVNISETKKLLDTHKIVDAELSDEAMDLPKTE